MRAPFWKPPPEIMACMIFLTPVMLNQIRAPNQANTHQFCVSMKVRKAGRNPTVTLLMFRTVVLVYKKGAERDSFLSVLLSLATKPFLAGSVRPPRVIIFPRSEIKASA